MVDVKRRRHGIVAGIGKGHVERAQRQRRILVGRDAADVVDHRRRGNRAGERRDLLAVAAIREAHDNIEYFADIVHARREAGVGLSRNHLAVFEPRVGDVARILVGQRGCDGRPFNGVANAIERSKRRLRRAQHHFGVATGVARQRKAALAVRTHEA